MMTKEMKNEDTPHYFQVEKKVLYSTDIHTFFVVGTLFETIYHESK